MNRKEKDVWFEVDVSELQDSSDEESQAKDRPTIRMPVTQAYFLRELCK